MSLLDSAIHIGEEGTFATAASLTRSFEGKADSFKRQQDFIESVGMRASMQTVRSDRRVVVNMGGSGSLELDVLSKGFGMLFKGLLGSTTGPTQQASTIAYASTFASTDDGPSTSYTIQHIRPFVATNSTQQFTHLGCQATKWGLKQAVGGLLTLGVDYSFADVDIATAAGTATYPSSTSPFDWTQCVVTVGGSSFDVRSFDFEADMSMKVDRRYLRGSATMKQPVRGGVPQYGGTIEADFDSTTRYAEFVAGTVSAMAITWTGANIVSSHYYTVTLTLPAIQWTGDSPEASISEVTKQSLPFRVLHDGSNPAVTLSYKSTDSAL